MIGTIVFVLAFLVLGLTVVGIALRGRGPAAGETVKESRGQRRAWATGISGLILLVGVAVPVLVLLIDGHDAAKSAPHGVDLNASATRGRQLFATNCATCHTLAASNSVGRVGPNLDNLRPPAALVLDAVKNGRADGSGQMPALLLQGQDAKDIAAYVTAVAGHNQ